ncbi:MAG: hypothetical protein ACYS5W_07745 [Planctomycetota bacterium]
MARSSTQIDTNNSAALEYDPNLPLLIHLDFNISPGVAEVAQEQQYQGTREEIADVISAYIGEVYIPRHSNTPMVCRRLIKPPQGRRLPLR